MTNIKQIEKLKTANLSRNKADNIKVDITRKS